MAGAAQPRVLISSSSNARRERLIAERLIERLDRGFDQRLYVGALRREGEPSGWMPCRAFS